MKFLTPTWNAPSNVKAYTTLKQSWSGRGQDENGTVLQTLVAAPSAPIWLDQKHTADAVEANEVNRLRIADASFSTKPNKVCAVITADCLPILVCNKNGTEVAAIHAGWRGLAAGIIENTIAQLASKPEELLIWFGPAIGPTKFEVGQDVYNAFVSKQPDAISAFTSHDTNKWLANLYSLASLRLQKLGITDIYGGEYCTHSQADLFYSFRRKDTGRLASLIWFE